MCVYVYTLIFCMIAWSIKYLSQINMLRCGNKHVAYTNKGIEVNKYSCVVYNST